MYNLTVNNTTPGPPDLVADTFSINLSGIPLNWSATVYFSNNHTTIFPDTPIYLAGGEKVEIDFIEFFRKHISIFGCGRSTKVHVEKVLQLMAEGYLKPIIHKTYNLSDASLAHELMESRNFFGRMVLTR